MDKRQILSKFSADPEKYYKVNLVLHVEDFFGLWIVKEAIALKIQKIPIHLLEIHQQKKDLIIRKLGRRLNLSLLRMAILLLAGIQWYAGGEMIYILPLHL